MSTRQRYSIQKKINAGGMAEIFLGSAVSLDGIQKRVAIKRIRPHLASNQKFIRMFIDEARLSMRLNHANIVQVFDIGRAQDTYFLVMEYVDGANLRRILQVSNERGFSIPIEVSMHVAIEVCKGLSHAHSAVDEHDSPLKIVHRDVSPPNVLISQSGEVKITDFGLARAMSQLEATDPGIVKGKFSYLSPEACEGLDLDARADIFSCGIILHELMTGRRLFQGKTELETVELIRKCEVPPPSRLNGNVPKDLDEVVLRALARDRRKRYQSIGDMADALAQSLFANKLKVTTFDVARMMSMLFGEGEDTSYPRRVVEIIHEEIINLSSLGKLPGLTPVEGVEPLDISAFRSRKTPFEDVWKDIDLGQGDEQTELNLLSKDSPEAARAADVAASASRAAAKKKEKKERKEKKGKPTRARSKARVAALIALLGLSAAIAAAYYIFRDDLPF